MTQIANVSKNEMLSCTELHKKKVKRYYVCVCDFLIPHFIYFYPLALDVE